MNAEQFKEIAGAQGADLVGIASIERFELFAPEAHPLAIQPKTRSVIVLGFSIPRGSLQGVESGTAGYTLGAGLPTTLAIETTYQLCRRLENAGWEATPLFRQEGDMRGQGVRVSPDKPEPNVIVEFDFAAHAAGLGEIGRSKMLLTPQFGPRQMLTLILTDAELEPDAPFAGSVCDDCGACADACPAGALDASGRRCAPLCEGEACWYPLHVESCRVCRTGTIRLPYSTGSEPFRLGAACGRACVAHLEDEGLLTRSFASPFRERPGSTRGEA
ncbi:MAG: 4Fe-4S binding protein [Armatimonadota bacterium]